MNEIVATVSYELANARRERPRRRKVETRRAWDPRGQRRLDRAGEGGRPSVPRNQMDAAEDPREEPFRLAPLLM